jgi:hypothetical protein
MSMLGQGRTIPTAPPPPDPYEIVSGPIYVATQPVDRVAAMNLIRTAAKSGITHNADMNPFDYQVKFNATGIVADTGSGELTETWLSGQNWRVTIDLGNYSMVRLGYSGKVGDQIPVSSLPMRAQMLRNEVMWAVGHWSGGVPESVRTSNAMFNGQPVTCVLLSGASSQWLRHNPVSGLRTNTVFQTRQDCSRFIRPCRAPIPYSAIRRVLNSTARTCPTISQLI